MDKRVPARMTFGNARARLVLGAALLVMLPLAAYIPAYRATFVSDDDAQVVRNERLRSASGLAEIWTDLNGTDGTYYPLTFTTYWLEYQTWGMNPAPFHIDNIILHAINALLVWGVLRRLGVPGSWIAGAIFALHPVHVESVAWVTERRNTLSTAFYLLSVIAYLRFRPLGAGVTRGAGAGSSALPMWPRRAGASYVLSLALFIAALLSKTATLSLPAALLLIAWWKRGRLERSDIIPLVPYFALAMAASLMTLGLERDLVGQGGPGWGRFSAAERLIVAGRAVWFYIGKLLVPINLSFVYPRWAIEGREWSQYVYPAAALALPVILFACRARIGRSPATAVLFFGGTIFPVLGFIDYFYMMISFVADRFLYLPSVGIIALVTSAAALGLRAVPRVRGLALAAAVFVLASLGALAWQRSACFTSVGTLYGDVLDKHPDSWVAHYSLGAHLAASGRSADAIPHLEEALRLKPNFPSIRGYLAAVYSQTGRHAEALPLYEEALRQNPADEEIHTNLGMTYVSLGRYEEAIEEYGRALEINPSYAPALRNLERVVLYRLDRLRAAESGDAAEFLARMRGLAARLGAENLLREIDRRADDQPTR